MSFTYKRIINYYETDKMGVVHHSNYIRFLEEARSRWLEKYDVPMSKLEKIGYTIPTLEVHVKYKSHVTEGDTILITPRISEYNGVRMTVVYDVVEEKTGNVIIEASTKHCFTDINLRPINMKKKNEEINKIFDTVLKD